MKAGQEEEEVPENNVKGFHSRKSNVMQDSQVHVKLVTGKG